MTPAGITIIPITGTASRFANSPYSAIRLKCAAAIGAVAVPAISDDSTAIATGRITGGNRFCTLAQCSNPTISAAVAPNDI